MNIKKLITILQQKEEKYFSLVWYGRTNPDNLPKEIQKHRREIEEKYLDEIIALWECKDNWQHGFNSGMLAGIRYILDVACDRQEEAEEEFPFLDT
jgi:hypothetical protein